MKGGPYRDAAGEACVECARLRCELARYENAARELRPHQMYYKNPVCISCNGPLYEAVDDVDSKNRKAYQHLDRPGQSEDETFCTGRRARTWWFGQGEQLCPPLPHVHRYCSWCKARWLEEIAEQTNKKNGD